MACICSKCHKDFSKDEPFPDDFEYCQECIIEMDCEEDEIEADK